VSIQEFEAAYAMLEKQLQAAAKAKAKAKAMRACVKPENQRNWRICLGI
jgi:hypothetical protein